MTDVRPVPLKAPLSKEVTVGGRITAPVKLAHPQKASCPIPTRLLGNVTDVRLVFLKQYSFNDVTEFGITTSFRVWHPSNKPRTISVRPLPNTAFVTPLFLNAYIPKLVMVDGMVTVPVKLAQFSKADSPSVVNLSGSTTDVRSVPLNADFPKLVMVEGMVTVPVKLAQFSKADSPSIVNPSGSVTNVRPVPLKVLISQVVIVVGIAMLFKFTQSSKAAEPSVVNPSCSLTDVR